MKISVYITSYNQKGYLAEAVESVLAQTLKPHQVIIVDDCSTDGSRELIEAYRARHPRLITPVLHERNAGIGQSRVDALAAVTGDFATYVDGDDRFLPGKLEGEAAALRAAPGARMAFSNYYYIDETGRRTGLWADGEKPPQGDIFKEVFARAFPRGNLFRCELVDYAAWKETGFHDPRLNLFEDYEMRVRLAKRLCAVYNDEPLSEYRIHGKGLSKAGGAISRLEVFEYIFEKNRGLLDDLGPRDREFVEKSLAEKMAMFSRRVSRESARQLDFFKAARYFIRSLQAAKLKDERRA